MKITSFLKANITEPAMLEKFAEYLPHASLVAIHYTDVQLFIQILGSKDKGFDLTYIKTPNQLKVKKNNRPIIFLPNFKAELLRKYKTLSPWQLMSLIWKMVTVWKSEKLVRDEAYLQRWLNFPLDNVGSFRWHNFNRNKKIKIVSNIKFNWLEEGYVSRDQMKNIYIQAYMNLWSFYFIKYLVKKYKLTSKKKIIEYLSWWLDNKIDYKERISYEKEQERLVQFKEENNMTDESLIDMFIKAKWTDRIPMKMTWYFKVKKQYEPDSTNMAQLYEDEYQVKMEWIKFDWNDKYLMQHDIRKFLMRENEDKFEYLAIMENML